MIILFDSNPGIDYIFKNFQSVIAIDITDMNHPTTRKAILGIQMDYNRLECDDCGN